MTCAPKPGSVASSARIVYVAFEIGPWLRHSDATEFHAILDERDTHGARTGGERARNNDVAREGAMAVCVAVALFAGVLADCGR